VECGILVHSQVRADVSSVLTVVENDVLATWQSVNGLPSAKPRVNISLVSSLKKQTLVKDYYSIEVNCIHA
jgi:hypothetical protein